MRTSLPSCHRPAPSVHRGIAIIHQVRSWPLAGVVDPLAGAFNVLIATACEGMGAGTSGCSDRDCG